MFVLGIDPGLTRCGYGLVEGSFEGVETFRAVRAGTIETDPKMPVEQRLRQLHVELDQLLKETTPNAVAVERVFYQRNANTAISVAQASGVAIALVDGPDVAVRQFTAQQVKLAVTGYGALCGLSEIPRPADAADALALGIAYFMIVRIERRYPLGSLT